MVLSFLFLLGIPYACGKEVHGITSSSSSPIAATGNFGFKWSDGGFKSFRA